MKEEKKREWRRGEYWMKKEKDGKMEEKKRDF